MAGRNVGGDLTSRVRLAKKRVDRGDEPIPEGRKKQGLPRGPLKKAKTEFDRRNRIND